MVERQRPPHAQGIYLQCLSTNGALQSLVKGLPGTSSSVGGSEVQTRSLPDNNLL